MNDDIEKNKHINETTNTTTILYSNETNIQLDTELLKESYLEMDAMNHLNFHMTDLKSNNNVTAQRTNSNWLLEVAEESLQVLSPHLSNDSAPHNKALAGFELKRSPRGLIIGPGGDLNESGQAQHKFLSLLEINNNICNKNSADNRVEDSGLEFSKKINN